MTILSPLTVLLTIEDKNEDRENTPIDIDGVWVHTDSATKHVQILNSQSRKRKSSSPFKVLPNSDNNYVMQLDNTISSLPKKTKYVSILRSPFITSNKDSVQDEVLQDYTKGT